MKIILIIWALLISTVYGQSKSGFYVVGGKIITVQETESRTYLKAIEDAGVVPTITQNFASNYLVTSERAIGTYALMTAQYPFIGGTAATHKFNLNDPRDLDAAFRLTYSGTVTHSSLGIQGNGSNGYADTKLKLSSNISSTGLVSFGLYINNTPTIFGYDMGAFNDLTPSYSIININNTTTNFLSPFASVNSQLTVSNSFIQGFYQTTQNGTIKGYINGVPRTGTSSFVSGNIVNVNYYLMASNLINSGGFTAVSQFTNGRYGFNFFSSPLTDDQSAKQSIIVKNFNSILSR